MGDQGTTTSLMGQLDSPAQHRHTGTHEPSPTKSHTRKGYTYTTYNTHPDTQTNECIQTYIHRYKQVQTDA